eukprot:COSAG01_NODE_3879_length_5595_cov_34.137918_7_plen_115_part_00
MPTCSGWQTPMLQAPQKMVRRVAAQGKDGWSPNPARPRVPPGGPPSNTVSAKKAPGYRDSNSPDRIFQCFAAVSIEQSRGNRISQQHQLSLSRWSVVEGTATLLGTRNLRFVFR